MKLVAQDPEPIGAPIGTIYYMDGRVARTMEQRVEAVKQRREYKARREAENLKIHMDIIHPEGLIELRNSDGSVRRPAGSKPWIK